MDTELQNLIAILGIDENQVNKRKVEVNTFPEYFSSLKEEVHQHIDKVLARTNKDSYYWQVDKDSLHLIFSSYRIVSSHRKVERQLGNCNYAKKRIRLNFGNRSFTKDQCRRTLIHEYVHAITKEFYNYSGHGELFMFYNNLLQLAFKKDYRQKHYNEIQESMNAKT